MTLDERYEKLHRELGEKFNTSYRVIQAVRSAKASKYKELDFTDFMLNFRKDVEKKMVMSRQTLRVMKLDIVNDLTRRERGLKSDRGRFERLTESFPNVLKQMDTMALHESLVAFLMKRSEAVVKEIVETTLPEEEKEEASADSI